jgi:glycosidase
VKIAHDQGIKVILDFVSNHVHKEHPYFKEHRNWFGSMYLLNGEVNIRNWSEETRLTTWFDTFIPSYDFLGSQEAIDQVVDDAIWWLETFDFDGFRQDAVKHVPHRFWKRLTARMKEQFPDKDFYQIGESFGSDDLIKSYVNPAELSSQFNFSIYFNARGSFSADKADFSHIMKVIKENIEFYSPVHLMGNITSSHDQVRFMAFADGQVSFNENGTERAFNNPPGSVQNSPSYLKMANFTAFNMVLPGVPIIYYGDEIGLMGAGDPDNRRVMRFDPDLSEDETKLKNTVSTLTKLRRLYPSFAIGDFVPLLVEGPVMIFVKTYFDETILVAFNHCNDTNKITLDVSFHGMELVSLLSDDIITLNSGKASLILEPYSHQIWEVR